MNILWSNEKMNNNNKKNTSNQFQTGSNGQMRSIILIKTIKEGFTIVMRNANSFFFCVLQKPLWNQPFLFSNIEMENKHDWPLNSLHHKGKWTWKEKIKLILAWRQWFQKIEEIDTFCISGFTSFINKSAYRKAALNTQTCYDEYLK